MRQGTFCNIIYLVTAKITYNVNFECHLLHHSGEKLEIFPQTERQGFIKVREK